MAVLVVFALPALESSAFVGFVFPGEIALVLGGVLAFEHRVGLAAVLVAGMAGAVVGDSVGYAVGRRWGHRMLTGAFGRWVRREHLERGERYLVARGGAAVFVGRFTAALRVMIPGLAGMARMPYRTFAAYNIAGGVIWAAGSVLLGYLAGTSWRHVEHVASRVGLTVVAVAVLLVLAFRFLRRGHGERLLRAVSRLSRSRPVRAATERFPGISAWLGHRFGRGETGLTLTLLVAVAAASLWLFLGVTQDVLAHEEFARADPRVLAFVLAHRQPWLTPVMEVATWLGSSVVLVPLLIVAAVVMYRATGRRWPSVALVGLYAGASLLHALLAELVRRPRPPDRGALVHAVGWAYPSGHAMQVVVALGGLIMLFGRDRPPRLRAVLAGVAVVVVPAVAVSPVYLGAHWFTDVVAGLCLGLAWLAACLAVLRLFLPWPPVRPVTRRAARSARED